MQLTIIVQWLNVTIVTDSAKPTVIYGMHTDKDNISKLCRVCIAGGSNYLSACEKKLNYFCRLLLLLV